MSKSVGIRNSDAIVAIDARGFIFGTALSLYTKPLILLFRKLPGNLISDSYELEYGKYFVYKVNRLRIINFSIVDDLLATGGTAVLLKMLINQGKVVKELVVVVELEELQGKSKLNCDVNSQIIL